MTTERVSPNAAWVDFSTTAIKGISMLVPIGGVVLALRLNPVNAKFPELSKENVLGLLMGLVVIALFIERAVEVLLTPFRGPTCLRMKHEKTMLEKDKPDSAVRLWGIESQLLEYKGRTRNIAFFTALALGMTISASGVRGMASLMDANGCCSLFRVLDVLLTGALLAGGAEGLHRIIAVFVSYMDKSARENAQSA